VAHGRAIPLAAWLCAVILSGSCLAQSAPAKAAEPRRGGPQWLSKRRAWDEARRDLQTARWGGTIDEIVAASERSASAESAYVESLDAWARSDSSGARGAAVPSAWYHPQLRHGALDLIEHGRPDAAIRLLDGPLRSDRSFLPIRARAVGLHVSRDSGLALLAWPPDRRGGRERAIRWDFLGRAQGDEVDAAHVAAAEIADSLLNARARRAALWTLLQQPRPALRSFARIRLARSLVARHEPRLAAQILTQSYGISDEEKVMLVNLKADLAGAMGDTLWGAIQMVNAARDPEIATAARYAIVKRAAEWLRGSRVDQLDESAWLDLVRMLGEVGEADTGLSILKRRHVPARDPAASLARAEMEATLLAKLKRNADAASAYSKLVAREDLPASSRAKYALGLARARRGLGEFEAMDRTFLQAVSLDSTSATASVAAWERAREWEDKKPPAEALSVFSWTRRYVRDGATTQALMAHATIACIRAGQPDSALPFIADAYANPAHYWRGRIAFAKGDSAAGFGEFARITLNDPWSYEGVRAAEELARRDVDPARPGGAAARSKGKAAASRDTGRGRATRADPEIPIATRLLGAVGATDLMVDALRDHALREGDPMARSCIDALEEIGIFRVGRADGAPKERLEYPPAYPVSVLASAKRESLSAALLWAIMRQESAYQRAARSKAGAVGLLQLLPSTASRLNRAPVLDAALTEPDLNVRLGAKYLRGLVTEFGDPRAAMAAYNAGEEAVRRWLRDRPVVDDLWVELIPYRETRDYVKQVYTIWRRYEALYGVPSADQL
jgi:soluble lytic murein transglycosylase-like protein